MECRRVLCNDPHMTGPDLTPLDEMLDQADLLIVGAPHDCYKDLTFRQPVIDITSTIRDSRSDRRDAGGDLGTPHR